MPAEGRRERPDRHDRHVVVAALGHERRGDDGVGPAVLDALGARPEAGAVPARSLASPFDLLGFWDGAELAVVIDAVRTGAAAGEVHVLELAPGGAAPVAAVSSHGLGLVEVLRLAHALEAAPVRVVLVGVEGAHFGHGAELSPAVRRAVEPAARAVGELLGGVASAVADRDDRP